jgi:hypothetical protein
MFLWCTHALILLEAFVALTALAEAVRPLHAAGDEGVEEQSTVSIVRAQQL